MRILFNEAKKNLSNWKSTQAQNFMLNYKKSAMLKYMYKDLLKKGSHDGLKIQWFMATKIKRLFVRFQDGSAVAIDQELKGKSYKYDVNVINPQIIPWS